MRNRFTSIGACCVIALAWVTTAPAQTPASDSVVVASPTYTSIPMEIDVDRPAADVWQRVGGYSAISESGSDFRARSRRVRMTNLAPCAASATRCSWGKTELPIPTRRPPERADPTPVSRNP